MVGIGQLGYTRLGRPRQGPNPMIGFPVLACSSIKGHRAWTESVDVGPLEDNGRGMGDWAKRLRGGEDDEPAPLGR